MAFDALSRVLITNIDGKFNLSSFFDYFLQTSMEYLTFAALSKMFAAATTYPYQVVRSRLQEQHRSYNGVWDCVKQIWV